jgi:hypothetical protein
MRAWPRGREVQRLQRAPAPSSPSGAGTSAVVPTIRHRAKAARRGATGAGLPADKPAPPAPPARAMGTMSRRRPAAGARPTGGARLTASGRRPRAHEGRRSRPQRGIRRARMLDRAAAPAAPAPVQLMCACAHYQFFFLLSPSAAPLSHAPPVLLNDYASGQRRERRGGEGEGDGEREKNGKTDRQKQTQAQIPGHTQTYIINWADGDTSDRLEPRSISAGLPARESEGKRSRWGVGEQ